MNQLFFGEKHYRNKFIDTTGELFPGCFPEINEQQIVQNSWNLVTEMAEPLKIFKYMVDENRTKKYQDMDVLRDVPWSTDKRKYIVFKERYDSYNLNLHPQKYLKDECELYFMWTGRYELVKERNLKNNDYDVDDIGIAKEKILNDIKKTFKENMYTKASKRHLLKHKRDITNDSKIDTVVFNEYEYDDTFLELPVDRYYCKEIDKAIVLLSGLVSYDILAQGDFLLYYKYDLDRLMYYVNLKRRIGDILIRKGLNITACENIYKKIENMYVNELKTLDDIENMLYTSEENNNKKFIPYVIKQYKKDNNIVVNNESLNIVAPAFIQRRVDARMESIDNNIKETSSNIMLSKDEKEMYKILCDKFGKENIKKEYKSERYPFRCDFYITTKDLFIEYQGYWSHGGEKYIGTKKQQEKLNEVMSKIQENYIYRTLIDTWTVKDVVKRQWAKNHNLNWIEFFNLDEFNKWIENNP